MTNKVSFLFKTIDINHKFSELAEKAEKIYISAAWVTHFHDAYKVLLKNKHKIQRFFCGIERNLTTPEVIKDFLDQESFRVIDHPDLFHHKAYIFFYKDQKGIKRWETLIGSANLTSSGFGHNLELMQHTVFDELINLEEELDKQLLKYSKQVDKAFLERYQLDYQESAKDYDSVQVKRRNQRTSFYHLSWDQFFNKVQSDDFHSLKGRLDLLDRVQSFLREYSFDELSIDDRKRIAGTYIGQDPEIQDFDTRWFGGMSGAGYFAQNVIKNPEPIAKAISKIPRQGRVTQKNYDEFIELMIPASGYKGDPLSVCTRILSMVRPDYFFCITSANIEGLAEDLNFVKSSLSTKNYWFTVVAPLIESHWWQEQDFNSDLEKRVWNYRVAMLDALYYKPKNETNNKQK